jgi:peptide/nickel transport system substrate-binding protein
MKRVIVIAIVASMVASIVAGCAPAAAPTATSVPPTKAPPTAVPPTPVPPTAVPPTATPAGGGTLIVASSAQPDSMFPDFTATGAGSSAQSVVYSGLTKQFWMRKFAPPEDLAESWTVSADQLTWTFKLRQGVKWHDGEPFTAEDVKFSYEFAAHPEYTGSGFATVSVIKGAMAKQSGEADGIEGVKVIDDYTISFTTNEPYALFLENVAPRPILPAHLLQDVPVEELGQSSIARTPIGTGPYMLTEWKPDESLTFKAFDDYFGEEPNFETYIWKIIPEMGAQVTELLAGGVHMVGGVSADDFPALQSNPELQTIGVPGSRFSFVEMNLANPLFQDLRVRQALNHAVDRDAMLQALNGGLGTIVLGPVHPSLPEFSPHLTGFAFDPDESRRLLREAGWYDEGGDGVIEAHGVEGFDDGTPFRFKLGAVTIGQYVQQGLIVQQFFKDIGVEAEIEEVGFNIYFSEYLVPGSDFDMAVSSWGSLYYHPHVDLEYSYFSKMPFAMVDNYANDEVDALLLQAPTIFDQDERLATYWNIQDLIVADAHRIFLTNADALYAFDKDLVLPEFGSSMDIWASMPRWYWK